MIYDFIMCRENFLYIVWYYVFVKNCEVGIRMWDNWQRERQDFGKELRVEYYFKF